MLLCRRSRNFGPRAGDDFLDDASTAAGSDLSEPLSVRAMSAQALSGEKRVDVSRLLSVGSAESAGPGPGAYEPPLGSTARLRALFVFYALLLSLAKTC